MSATSVVPNPQSWTIRLKHHKTTILLHVEPLLLLSSLKEELFAVLKNTSPHGLNGQPLPESAADIKFAKPIDPFDISQGWEPLEPSIELDDEFSMDEDVPKGRAKQLDSECLKAYDIKDNAVLAFRFNTEKGRTWDVVQAVHIDEYGVENEGDMGVIKEYRG